nr:uncharacterized protein LOC114824892 isoform X2 [Malus domestica]
MDMGSTEISGWMLRVYWPPAALCLHIRTLQPLIWVNHGIGYITTHIPRCYYKYIPFLICLLEWITKLKVVMQLEL